jgi:hypothetical protein
LKFFPSGFRKKSIHAERICQEENNQRAIPEELFTSSGPHVGVGDFSRDRHGTTSMVYYAHGQGFGETWVGRRSESF